MNSSTTYFVPNTLVAQHGGMDAEQKTITENTCKHPNGLSAWL